MRFACNVYVEVELTTTSGWDGAPHGCIVHGVRDTHPRICRFNLLNTFVSINRCDTATGNSRGKAAEPHLRCFFGLGADGSCAFSCSTLDLQVKCSCLLLHPTDVVPRSFAAPNPPAAGASACACCAPTAWCCCTVSKLQFCRHSSRQVAHYLHPIHQVPPRIAHTHII